MVAGSSPACRASYSNKSNELYSLDFFALELLWMCLKFDKAASLRTALQRICDANLLDAYGNWLEDVEVLEIISKKMYVVVPVGHIDTVYLINNLERKTECAMLDDRR